MSSDIIRECKFAMHIPKYENRPDLHYIKEILTYPDGRTEKNLRLIKNFKRPYYIVKEHFRNYKQKKESEPLDKLNKYEATESDMVYDAGRNLGGIYVGKNAARYVKDCPYVYGMDISSSAFIKRAYDTKFNHFTLYDVCVLDIEKEIDGEQRITVISISDDTRTYTAINSNWLEDTKFNRDELKATYDKYVPKTDDTENIEVTNEFFDTELKMIQAIFAKLHEWGPDMLEVWNISYDIGAILEVLERENVNPATVFSDPSVPDEFKYFRFKKGKTSRMTEKGVHKGLDYHEQWHTVITPAKFYIVDGMSAYYYIRQGGKQVPTGYGLDSILGKELGDKFKKIKIEDGVAEHLEKTDWHLYMSKKRKIPYVVYNQYDTRGPKALDRHTKDLCQVMPLLSVYSPFTIFDSNPSRIVEAFYFFYLERGEVMGVAPNTKDDNKRLGMGKWILMLSTTNIKDNGLRITTEDGIINTRIRGSTFDSDQSAGYPSNGQVANVSKDTTMRELLAVSGHHKEDFKKQNINLFFGEVNHLEYTQTMMKFPSLFKVDREVKKYLKEKNRNISIEAS